MVNNNIKLFHLNNRQILRKIEFRSGIMKITDDIYNVSNKSDIIVCVKII